MVKTEYEIDLLLTCNHIIIEDLEEAMFTPSIGDKRTCNVCGKKVQIAKVGMSMRKRKPTKQNKKPRLIT